MLLCMGKTEPTVHDVLQSARQMLEFARLGARDYQDAGDRRLSGLYNAVTSGRSVTFVLQKLRGRAPGFDQWYSTVRASLTNDPNSKWFHDLRNQIEKEGSHGPTTVTMSNVQLDQVPDDAPPNATASFIGDHLGRSGWFVQLPDGSEAKVYFKLPESTPVNVYVQDAPGGRPLEELLPEWLSKLDVILVEAEAKFGAPAKVQ